MDMTLQNAYAQAVSANNIYSNNQTRWQFLFDSYVGGEVYRNGGYLTRYQLETEGEYALRLRTTPLDNQCRSIIATYISFLFRTSPERDLGSLTTELTVGSFLQDADWEGRSIDSFMKQAATWANVFGHSWIIMSKPAVGAVTRADEIAMQVRPYVNLLTPLVVTDWTWQRNPNGSYSLSYFKYIEDVNGDETVIREWTPELITTTKVDTARENLIEQTVDVNELGMIPAVIVYAHTSTVRGIGLSTIEDIADAQRFIYNMQSEVEQAVRLGSHPSLVKTKETQAGAGAGSIIELPENMDPGLKPYVLEFSGQDVSSIYNAIDKTVGSIDKMANTGSIRATEAREMSGISRQVEFQLLDARLSEQADNIELAEEQLWKMYAAYQGYAWDGEIEYPDSFAISDDTDEMQRLVTAFNTIQSPARRELIEHEIMELIDITDASLEAAEIVEDAFTVHYMVNPDTGDRILIESAEAHDAAVALGYMEE